MKKLHIIISKGWHAQVANAYLIIKQQRESGENIEVCCLINSKIDQRLKKEGIVSRIFNFKHYNNPVAFLIFWKLLKKGDYQIVHLHGYNGKTRLWFACKFSRNRAPVICSSRDQPKPGFFFRKFFWTHFTHVLVPNQLVLSQLSSVAPCHSKMTVLNPPVDTNRFQPLPKKKNSSVKIGMFARFDTVKGYPIFFEACQILRDKYNRSDFQVIIGGTNFEIHRDTIDGLLENYRLREITKVIGETVSIENEIAKLDIGVIASVGSEELSRIALEYMSCGVPVIATRVGGLPECITFEEGGIVPPDNPHQLAKQLNELIDNPELRQKKGAHGRKKALEQYSVQKHCESLERDFYSQPNKEVKSILAQQDIHSDFNENEVQI